MQACGVCVHAELFDRAVDRVALRPAIKVAASLASSEDVHSLLQRISVELAQDEMIPCCMELEDLPALSAEVEAYIWHGREGSPEEVEAGRR